MNRKLQIAGLILLAVATVGMIAYALVDSAGQPFYIFQYQR